MGGVPVGAGSLGSRPAARSWSRRDVGFGVAEGGLAVGAGAGGYVGSVYGA